jgi:hypothetical protein
MMPMSKVVDEDRWTQLRGALSSTMAQQVPGWGDHSDSDPGVAVVQLFAFLAENLLARIDGMPERSVRLFEATIAELSRRRAEREVETFSGAKRVHFFSGQVLTSTDFNAEQQYHLQRRHLHNRSLHGSGVVNGLEVTVSDEPGSKVIVEPGLALDALGRELELTQQVIVALTMMESPQYVVIEYAERKTDFVAVAGEPDPIASRIEEGVTVRLKDEQPGDDALAIARLVRDANEWRVDTSFVRPLVDRRG